MTGDWVNAGGIVVLEESLKAEIAPVPGLTFIDSRDYGDTKVCFYRREDSPPHA